MKLQTSVKKHIIWLNHQSYDEDNKMEEIYLGDDDFFKRTSLIKPLSGQKPWIMAHWHNLAMFFTLTSDIFLSYQEYNKLLQSLNVIQFNITFEKYSTYSN